MERYRGAIPGAVGVLFGAALEVSSVNSDWLAISLFTLGVALLGLWAVPFFRAEWDEARSEIHLERMRELQRQSALSLIIDEEGRVSGSATVTGRFWFQRHVVVDDIYVLFWQRERSRFWRRRVTLRAPMNSDSRQLSGLPQINGWRLEPGEQIKLRQTLFSDLLVTPREPAKHGKFHADLYVDLLVPHRKVKLKLGKERVGSGARK